MLTTKNINSLVIDRLCDESREKDIAVAMFYCDFRHQQDLTVTNIIGAILKQLVVKNEVLEHVQAAFQVAKTEVGGQGPQLPDMVEMQKQAVVTLPWVFICIDALGECLSKHLRELLESMRDVLEKSPRARIILTGRPQAEAKITSRFTNPVSVPISPRKHDVKRYLEKKLEIGPESEVMSKGLREDIPRVIPERISEMCVGASIVPIPCMMLC